MDPILSAATSNQYGDRRFYPPGQHPLHRYRQHLAELESFRQDAYLRIDTTLTDECIAYIKDKIAAFEEGESIEKARYLRMVDGPSAS